MNKFQLKNKKLKAIFLLTLALVIFGSGLALDSASALNEEPVIFKPQVTIPGSTFIKGATSTLEASTGPIARYISAIYNYGVGIVGILAALMLMIGGIIWLTAAGSSSKIEQAKSFISSSLTGMALVLTAYILLKTINPALVDLKTTEITILDELQCCESAGSAVMTYPSSCKGTLFDLDYLVSLDNKKCVKGGCCIDSTVPASVLGAITTVLSSDNMSQTKLAYKSSLKDGCSTGLNYGLADIYMGVLKLAFGSQTNTFFIDSSCSEVKKKTCAAQPDGKRCFGETRYGYCYGSKCSTKEGIAGSLCGNEPASACKADSSCTFDFGGLGCGSGLYCCKGAAGTAANNVAGYLTTCGSGDDKKSCKNASSRNLFGYCDGGTCKQCSHYDLWCPGMLEDQACPNQHQNARINPNGQCGISTSGFDTGGDCSCNLAGTNCTCDSDD